MLPNTMSVFHGMQTLNMPIVVFRCLTCGCRYGEDHEPKEPKEADDGGAWDDDEALQHMLGEGAVEDGGGTNMQTLD